MKFKNPTDINQLSDEEFDNLSPEQIRQQFESQEESDDSQDEFEDEEDLDEEDQPEEEEQESESEDEDEESNSEEVDDEQEESDEDPEEDSEESDDKESEELPPTNQGMPQEPTAKQPKQKDVPPTSQPTDVDATVAMDFYKKVTAPFKAIGTEFQITDPNELISLAQKGLDYSRKMGAINHLRGMNEVLRENNIDDSTLGYLIDLHNHKPEAIARLLQESKLDAFELDEEKASAYQQPTYDFQSKAQVANVAELVAAHQEDAAFNDVFNQARQWDDLSQQELVKNPNLLVTLADHKRSGAYDQIMNVVLRQQAIQGVTKPTIQHYYEVGNALFGNQGGSAQAPTQTPTAQQPAAQRVIVKTPKNVAAQRKRVAPHASGSTPSRKGHSFKSPQDIYRLPDDEFDKIDPSTLRKMLKG